MACKELLESVSNHQLLKKLACPVLMTLKCHPSAHFLVHVDGKRRMIYLSCSRCDKLISLIRLGGRINKGMVPKEGGGDAEMEQ